VLELSETRWLQESSDCTQDTEDGAFHTDGVILMLPSEAQQALIGWEPVNSRIITAKFTIKKRDIKLSIRQCYAHTNDAGEEKKDDFYQQHQALIQNRGAKDMMILMGDFNTKTGADIGYDDITRTREL
jgi:exonuclease III